MTRADHSAAGMLAAGRVVTVNRDDPSMFGADLTGEYLNAGRTDQGHAHVRAERWIPTVVATGSVFSRP